MVQRKTTWSAKIIATMGEVMAAAMLRMNEQEKEIGRLRHHVSMLSKKLHKLQKFGSVNGEEKKEEVAREMAPSPELPVIKPMVAELPVTRKAEKREVAEKVVLVAPRKKVAGKVALVAPGKKVAEEVALVAPDREVETARVASREKRLASEDEDDRRGGDTGWRVITCENKKRLVKRVAPKGSEPGVGVDRDNGNQRVGFVFQHVEGCANDTPERDDFLRGVLDRVQARKTHRGVVKMLMEGKGCLNCSFDWRDAGERIWIPGDGV
ncbi:hypothetical protein HOY82DRAFT_595054 [Tuber indicum]|nr:hypothetical protein HOY82DRAFT_595054 [Tuber indicum]